MGPVYSIRSGRDDPRGCYAGSGESLAAWAGGIYRSRAGAECRLLAQSTRSDRSVRRHANWRIWERPSRLKPVSSDKTIKKAALGGDLSTGGS